MRREVGFLFLRRGVGQKESLWCASENDIVLCTWSYAKATQYLRYALMCILSLAKLGVMRVPKLLSICNHCTHIHLVGEREFSFSI